MIVLAMVEVQQVSVINHEAHIRWHASFAFDPQFMDPDERDKMSDQELHDKVTHRLARAEASKIQIWGVPQNVMKLEVRI